MVHFTSVISSQSSYDCHNSLWGSPLIAVTKSHAKKTSRFTISKLLLNPCWRNFIMLHMQYLYSYVYIFCKLNLSDCLLIVKLKCLDCWSGFQTVPPRWCTGWKQQIIWVIPYRSNCFWLQRLRTKTSKLSFSYQSTFFGKMAFSMWRL